LVSEHPGQGVEGGIALDNDWSIVGAPRDGLSDDFGHSEGPQHPQYIEDRFVARRLIRGIVPGYTPVFLKNGYPY